MPQTTRPDPLFRPPYFDPDPLFRPRFNRLRGENGHLFQGRYRAFVLENSGVWARVADYIHLNPVRAGIVPVEHAAQFRWSSFAQFFKNKKFNGLDASAWLVTLGLTDSPTGWAEYGLHLQRLMGSPSYSEETERAELSSGWAVGSGDWQQSLALTTNVDESADKTGERVEPIRMRQVRWQARLNELLAEANRNPAELDSSRKNAIWKVAITDELQRTQGASVGWLAENLRMGSAATARGYLWRFRKKRNEQNTA